MNSLYGLAEWGCLWHLLFGLSAGGKASGASSLPARGRKSILVPAATLFLLHLGVLTSFDLQTLLLVSLEFTTFSDGCLGSSNDEGRSEM